MVSMTVSADTVRVAGRRRKMIAGICKDAERLGVARQYLSSVLHRHRYSKSLLERYARLKKLTVEQLQQMLNNYARSDGGEGKPQHHRADAFLGWEWPDCLEALNLAAVALEQPITTAVRAQLYAGNEIGRELENLGGRLDSSRYSGPVRHFYVVPKAKLPAALELIRSALEQRGLLTDAKIGHCEPQDRIWRTFYPGITAS